MGVLLISAKRKTVGINGEVFVWHFTYHFKNRQMPETRRIRGPRRFTMILTVLFSEKPSHWNYMASTLKEQMNTAGRFEIQKQYIIRDHLCILKSLSLIGVQIRTLYSLSFLLLLQTGLKTQEWMKLPPFCWKRLFSSTLYFCWASVSLNMGKIANHFYILPMGPFVPMYRVLR